MPSAPSPPPGQPAQPRPGRLLLRGLLGTALLAALLLAGHALLWRWMASQVEAGFRDWAAQRRALGWQVAHAAPERGGWPFAATLTLPQFRVEGGAGTVPGGLEWQAERLVLRLAPPRLDRLTVDLSGRQRLRLGRLDLPFTADLLEATLPLERDVVPGEARLTAERLRLGTPAGPLEALSAMAEIRTRMTAIEGEPALSLRLEAGEIVLPPAAAAAAGRLGRAMEAVRLDLALTGPVPPGRDPASRAEAWRDGGGTLDLRHAEIRWGPVVGTVTATLTLDEALQPMGAGTLRLAGAGEALQAAGEAGLLTRQAVATGRTVLLLLGRKPAEGGPRQVEVPLTLEERVLAAARVPVLTLPAWHWPAAAPTLPARNRD